MSYLYDLFFIFSLISIIIMITHVLEYLLLFSDNMDEESK